MLSEMETKESTDCVSRDGPIGNTGLWIQGPLDHPPLEQGVSARTAARKWTKQWRDLAEHLEHTKSVRKWT